MGQFAELKAADGQAISAYVAQPKGQAKGGIVVIQEIFGVNAHIRAVADGYAEQGYGRGAGDLPSREAERGTGL